VAATERPLTKEEKETIYGSIHRNMKPDDRAPKEVIAETYGGDEQRYLLAMALMYGIRLDVDNVVPEPHL